MQAKVFVRFCTVDGNWVCVIIVLANWRFWLSLFEFTYVAVALVDPWIPGIFHVFKHFIAFFFSFHKVLQVKLSNFQHGSFIFFLRNIFFSVFYQPSVMLFTLIRWYLPYLGEQYHTVLFIFPLTGMLPEFSVCFILLNYCCVLLCLGICCLLSAISSIINF